MDFTGRYVIAAPPQRVWDGINDPAVLKACIPGCEQLDKTSPTEFVATAKLKIGPVSATFKGKVTLSQMEPPRRCVLTGEGQGGVAGFAKGGAEVILTPEGDATVLTYTAKASVGGKLAQIGQRLIDGAARQIADDFFGRFSQALTAAKSEPVLEPDPEGDAHVPSVIPSTESAQSRRDRPAPEIWVVGLVGVVVVLLLIFSAVL
jgi:carbon monoxide dehydrogenase subunit G